ncbi:tetratricopeptide repeat protein [Pseudomaricurvus alcaniphilus]|uniref:tetratricopeptide repeat protein n=1 Tax=Pseudomaricurvus alcaniphilus TaxID=1166482 RepID=UPI00140C1B47|nr:tetratricopeptide repeat protein [Pseudomaricurvus alcaniphilus]NHN36236.1 tetratricopeptide repeat protein [Pseudomaricurvus alcaniphilus]
MRSLTGKLLCGALLTSALAQAQPTAEEWLEVGNHFWSKGNTEQAIQAWSEAIQQDPKLATAHFNRCLGYARVDDVRAALNDCTRAFMLDPNYAAAYYYRGLLRSERLGDDRGSIADFDQALRLQPGMAAAYFKRGNARQRAGDPAGAIQDYQRAIELQPGDAEAYFNLGVVHAQQRATQAAKKALQQAANLYRQQGNQRGQKRALQALQSL